MNVTARSRNGGISRGWWIVTALFLASGITVGSSQYTFGLFVEPLESSFGWSRTQISASLSFTAVGSLMAPILGRLMDRYGARPVMMASLILMALSFLLRPAMTELWHWYALSTLQFIGYSGSSMLPAGRLIGIWFSRKRGRVMGITQMGNNFGGLVIPPVIGVTLVASSWRGGYLVLGGIVFIATVFALVVVREFPRASDDQVNQAASQPSTALTGWTTRQALRSKAFYAIAIAVSLGTFTYVAILPQVIAHLTNEGVSLTVASLALSALAVGGIVGKVGYGLLAERITARRALMVNLVGQATFVFLMIYAGAPAIMWVSVPLYGFCMGGFGALFTVIIQDTFGIKNFGSIMGIISMGTIVSFLVGPLLAGASFDITGSYATAFAIVAGLFVVASLSLTQASVPSDQVETT